MVTSKLMRAVSLAAMATASLYAVMVLVAEPTRSLAADNDYLDVDVVVAGTLSIDCSTSSNVVHINGGTAIVNGDVKSGSGTCTVITNDPDGYTLKWVVSAGTGAAGARTGTGHLNSYVINGSVNNAYKIEPFQGSDVTTAAAFTAASANDKIQWGGRVRANSSTQGGASMPSFGNDGAGKQFLHVATGTAVSIAKRTSETSASGDTEHLEFRVAYGSTAFTPASTYKARVTLSVVAN